MSRRREAMRLLGEGWSLSVVSRELGVSRAAIRDWRDHGIDRAQAHECTQRPSAAPYAALFGFYLGDGYISAAARTFVLRVSCDRNWPGIIEDVTQCIRHVHPARGVHRVRAPGVIVVQNSWKHWPCLIPQHGPGRKHERTLVMAAWQREIVESHPADFLRGLFHSDGARVRNWTTRVVAGERKRYDYPRWQFVNHSADIRAWCCTALDLAGVDWRQSSRYTISVSRRASVGRLDKLIGLKC